LDHIGDFVKAGVSTLFLNDELVSFLGKHGAGSACTGYMGYPKDSTISVNDVICHGIPSEEEILKEGDIVNVDIATIVDGYYGDTCRMYAVGDVSDRASNLIETAEECLNMGIGQAYVGNRTGNIGWAITRLAERRGYSVVRRFTGHGVGVELHEKPSIYHYVRDRNHGEVIRPGMIFTIEPMINEGVAGDVMDEDGWTARTADGKLSAQFEHTVLVTGSGPEILTLSS
jgi:methionyl aminopeptidase